MFIFILWGLLRGELASGFSPDPLGVFLMMRALSLLMVWK